MSDGFVQTKIYDKRDDLDFDTVNFHFLMVIFLVRHPMVVIFLNLFVLLECPIMFMNLTNCSKKDGTQSKKKISGKPRGHIGARIF